jgi:flagellin-like hook-associated protein FlgL
MAISDISLTGSMRAVLVSLQDTQSKIDRTSERLATGKKVNSPLDNPANFFAAAAHNDRASRLNARKDAISEAIQTTKAASNGVKGITTLIEAARGVLTSARTTTDATELDALATQYDELLTQIDNLASDSGYKGINFLAGDSLTVNFNEDSSTSLIITGFDASSTGLALTATGGAGTAIDTGAEIDALEAELDLALTTLRTNSTTLASNLSVLSTREAFITDMVNTLIEGANKLTLADLNEEGANLTLLQTQQQLGVTSLSIAAQSAQSVLRLF